MANSLSRLELLLGFEAVEKLKSFKVAVFGIGGVGSFAAESLVRSGINKFVLVDNDVVDITNLNRQIHATTKTLGQSKVEVMKNRILDINPEAVVITHQIFFDAESTYGVISNDIDYIIDAIDTVKSKILLAETAEKMGIPIISSMGTGNKLNPTMLEVTDINKTAVDPLARAVRKALRQAGINKLKVVYSKETPIVLSLGLQSKEDDTGDTENSNVNKKSYPGSASFVPNSAGLLIASEVIKDLLGL